MGSCGGGWEVRSYARREDANKMFSHANNCFQFSLRFFACFRYEQFFSLLWSRMQHLLDTCTCAQPAVKSNRTNTKKWYVFPFDSKKCVRTWNSMRIHRTFEPPMNAYATNRADDEWKSDKNWTPNEVISDELISEWYRPPSTRCERFVAFSTEKAIIECVRKTVGTYYIGTTQWLGTHVRLTDCTPRIYFLYSRIFFVAIRRSLSFRAIAPTSVNRMNANWQEINRWNAKRERMNPIRMECE